MHISKEVLDKLGIKETKEVETPQTLHQAIQAEKELELGMIRDGIARFHKGINKAKSTVNRKGNVRETSESITIYGQQLVQEGLEPMCEAINDYFIKAIDGHATKFASEAIILSKCIPIKDVENKSPERWVAISFITLKSVLDSVTTGTLQTKAIVKIGGAIEDEARLLYFKDVNSKAYHRVKEWLKKGRKQNYRHNRKIYAYAMNKQNLEWKGFTLEEKVKVGKLLLELLINQTGFVQFSNKYGKGKMFKYVVATKKTLDWIAKKKFHAEILKPERKPMIVTPKDWTTPYDGGYYIKELRPEALGSTLGEVTSNNQSNQEEQNNAL